MSLAIPTPRISRPPTPSKRLSGDAPRCVRGQADKATPCSNAFVTELSPAGNSLVYSTYLGGPGNNAGSAIALDGAGDAYVAGSTSSTGFPLRNALQASNGGNLDAFIARIGEPPATPTPVPPTATPTPLPPTLTPTVTPTAAPRSLHVAVRGALRANRSGTLRVRVSDPGPTSQRGSGLDAPVAGATVRLDARPVGVKKALKKTTNGQGVASFKNVHPTRSGVAVITVSKQGFPSVTLRVRVSA